MSLGKNGLHNVGQTCYLNSALQVLAHTPPLVKFYISGKYFNSIIYKKVAISDIVYQFILFLNKYWGTNDTHNGINPTDFVKVFSKSSGLAIGQSQDSMEALVHIVDQLKEDACEHIKRSMKAVSLESKVKFNKDGKPIYNSWQEYLDSHPSVITSIFTWFDDVLLEPLSCSHNCNTNDVSTVMALHIPEQKKNVELIDLIGKHYQGETIDYTCSKCNVKGKAKRTITCLKIPQVLAIHLKRYNNQAQKINTPMVIPSTLKVSVGNEECDGEEVETRVYHLYGQIEHSGSYGGGHYNSYCRHSESGEWVFYDDRNVSMRKPPQISSSSYGLFYWREE